MADLDEFDEREVRAFRALVEGTTHLVCLIGADGTIEYLSPSSKRLLGYLPEEATGLNAFDLLHPDDRTNAVSVLMANARTPADGLMERDDLDTPSEWRVRHKDGHYVTLDVLGNNFFGNPAIDAILVVGQNRSSRRLFENALVALSKAGLADEDYRVILDVLDTSVVSTTSMLYLADDSPTFVIGKELPDGIAVDDGYPLPWRVAIERGENVIIEDLEQAVDEKRIDPHLGQLALDAGYRSCWCFVVTSQLTPEGTASHVLGCIVVFSAIYPTPLYGYEHTIAQAIGLAELSLGRRRYERRLYNAAIHDHLTGLLNRPGFLEQTRSLASAGAVLLIDLDDFKHVNDTHGHAAGDDVLVELAKRMRVALRESDLLARLGGDEFAAYLLDTGPDASTVVANRIVDLASEPVVVDGEIHRLRVSIGIDCSHDINVEEQLRRADRSLYLAKDRGGNTVELNDPTS